MADRPSVSVIMPALNEERHLAEAVENILEQEYDGPLEVVIAVGPSRDRTLEVAERLRADHPNVNVVQNPSGKTPSGLNAAIAAATGDVIVRVDGHAMVPRGYVRTGVDELLVTNADNVGGVMAAEGVTPFQQSVARAMTSAFGVGGASFHLGGEAGPALTVYLGCFRRAALDRVGGYDETMERAQDWEMNLRIRQTGGVVWFTPRMQVTYRPRSSIRALARQYHDYGRWRREIARRHPETASLRYLAAPLTVVGVSAGLVVAAIGVLLAQPWMLIGLAAPATYLMGNLVASVQSALRAPRLSMSSSLRLPLVFVTMHAAWGTGFLRGSGHR